MSEENKYILQVKDLHTSFATDAGEVRAVNGVSFNLEPGKTLGIVGESGSGKSVFTKTFAGMLDSNGFIDNGKIIFSDEELSDTLSRRGYFQVERKADAEVPRGKVLDHFPGSDDKPESRIYNREPDL